MVEIENDRTVYISLQCPGLAKWVQDYICISAAFCVANSTRAGI
jgi:hypothetical protein